MGKFQKPIFYYKNESQLKVHYSWNANSFVNNREVPEVWKKYSLKKKENIYGWKVNLFGDPTDKDFEKKNIRDLDISILGLNRKIIKVHKKIKPILTKAFKEIAIWANKKGENDGKKYVFKTLYGYKFRYKRPGVSPRPQYINDQKAKLWYISKYPERSNWNRAAHIYCAEYNRLMNRFPSDKKNYQHKSFLSNHSFGTAIDINAASNRIQSPVWDMPKEIVQIMVRYGFYWGGFYVSKRGTINKDAMHFEYMLDFVDFPVATLPFSDIDKLESPIKYYYNNEKKDSGIGGFYCVGLKCNLHSGIHLFPQYNEGKKPQPVKCIAPGYIVAARLPIELKEKRKVEKYLHNWTGFVLVRHDFTEKEQNDKSFQFYSLYMHLAPPKEYKEHNFPDDNLIQSASNKKSASYNDVPWFKKIFTARYGTLVNISPEEDLIGESYWINQYVDTNNIESEYKVYGKKNPIKVKDGTGAFHFLPKKEPGHYSQTINDLIEGKIVTFSEPFLPVDTNEIIGYINPAFNRPKEDSIAKTKLKSGYLHFEIFSHSGEDIKDGIAEIIKIAESQLNKNMGENENSNGEHTFFKELREASEDQNNFLQLEEIKTRLGKSLSDNQKQVTSDDTSSNTLSNKSEKDSFLEVLAKYEQPSDENMNIKSFAYAKDVIEWLNEGTFFAPRDATDVKPPPEEKKYTYPITLQIDKSMMPSPSNNGLAGNANTYKIKVEFLKKKTDSNSEDNSSNSVPPGIITIDESKYNENEKYINLTIQIPSIDIDAIRLKSYNSESLDLFLSDDVIPIENNQMDFFKKITATRWRNTHIKHVNEWSERGVKGLFGILLDKGLFGQKGQDTVVKERILNDIAPLAYWKNSSEETKTSPKESHLFDNAGSLFGSNKELPYSPMIHNIHPVTFVWLLNLLDKSLEKIKIKNSWEQGLFKSKDSGALYWGWLQKTTKNNIVVGDMAYVIIISNKYGYDIHTSLKITATKGSISLNLGKHSFPSSGIIVVPVSICFWGNWQVEVLGHNKDKPPKPLTSRNIPLINKIEIKRPVFKNITLDNKESLFYKPYVHANGSLSWLIEVQDSMPSSLDGFISVFTNQNEEAPLNDWDEENYFIKASAYPCIKQNSYGDINKNDFNVFGNDYIHLSNSGKIKWDKLRASNKFISLKKIRITKNVSYYDYVMAHPFLLACSLADLLQKIRREFDRSIYIKSLNKNGRSCIICDLEWYKCYLKNLNQKSEKLSKKENELRENNDNLLDICRKNSNILAKKWTQEGTDIGILIIYRDKLKKKDECENIGAVYKKNWQISEKDPYYIKGCQKKEVSENFSFKEYQLNFDISLRFALVNALEELYKKTGKFALESLSEDGFSCIINCRDGKYEGKVNETLLFEVTPLKKHKNKSLNLTVNPSIENALRIDFKPKEVLDIIKVKSLSRPGEYKYFRYKFITVNGYKYLDVDEHLHKNFIDKNTFELIKKKSNEIVETNLSGIAGKIIKPAFGEFNYSIRSNLMDINVPLIGDWEDWKNGLVQLYYKKSSMTKFVYFKGQRYYLKSKLDQVTFSFPLKFAKGEKTSLQIKHKKLSRKKWNVYLEKTESFDFSPCLLGPIKFQILPFVLWNYCFGPIPIEQDTVFFSYISHKQKASENINYLNGWLELYCDSQGLPSSNDPAIESTEPWPKKKIKKAGLGIELKLTVSPDPSGLITKNIEYALFYTKKKGMIHGLCNKDGRFWARIPLRFINFNTKYTFKIERPEGYRKIFDKKLDPLSGRLIIQCIE